MRPAALRAFLYVMNKAVKRRLKPPRKRRRNRDMEIPLRRKYLEVTNGNHRSPATTGTAKKKRIEKTPRDRALAEANRSRPVPVMHLQANGKKRMKRPD